MQVHQYERRCVLHSRDVIILIHGAMWRSSYQRNQREAADGGDIHGFTVLTPEPPTESLHGKAAATPRERRAVSWSKILKKATVRNWHSKTPLALWTGCGCCVLLQESEAWSAICVRYRNVCKQGSYGCQKRPCSQLLLFFSVVLSWELLFTI